MIEPSVFYRAAAIEGTGRETLNLTKASLTTCTQPTPRWQFSCSKAYLKKDDYVEMWNALLTDQEDPGLLLALSPLSPQSRALDRFPDAPGRLLGGQGDLLRRGLLLGHRPEHGRHLRGRLLLQQGPGRRLGVPLPLQRGDGGRSPGSTTSIFKPGQSVDDSPDAYIFRLNHNQPLPLDFRLRLEHRLPDLVRFPAGVRQQLQAGDVLQLPLRGLHHPGLVPLQFQRPGLPVRDLSTRTSTIPSSPTTFPRPSSMPSRSSCSHPSISPSTPPSRAGSTAGRASTTNRPGAPLQQHRRSTRR